MVVRVSGDLEHNFLQTSLKEEWVLQIQPHNALARILARGYSDELFTPIMEGRAKNPDIGFLQLGGQHIWESEVS